MLHRDGRVFLEVEDRVAFLLEERAAIARVEAIARSEGLALVSDRSADLHGGAARREERARMRRVVDGDGSHRHVLHEEQRGRGRGEGAGEGHPENLASALLLRARGLLLFDSRKELLVDLLPIGLAARRGIRVAEQPRERLAGTIRFQLLFADRCVVVLVRRPPHAFELDPQATTTT